MIILGIDPGTTRIGYGIIRIEREPKLIGCGLFRITSKVSTERIVQAAAHFREIIARHRPELIAIEKLFFVKNQKTGLSVAETRGAITLLAREAGIAVAEYAPTEVKRIVAGFGNADKQAVHKMVCLSLKISSVPGPDDVSDALAVSLAAAYHMKFEKFTKSGEA